MCDLVTDHGAQEGGVPAAGGRGAPQPSRTWPPPSHPWLPAGPLLFPGSQCSLYVNNLSMTSLSFTRQASFCLGCPRGDLWVGASSVRG